jgi:hypothetical protein
MTRHRKKREKSPHYYYNVGTPRRITTMQGKVEAIAYVLARFPLRLDPMRERRKPGSFSGRMQKGSVRNQNGTK